MAAPLDEYVYEYQDDRFRSSEWVATNGRHTAIEVLNSELLTGGEFG